MDIFFDSIRQLHQNSNFDDVQAFLISNKKQVIDELDNCFALLENFTQIDKQIDNIYLIINLVNFDSTFTEAIISRSFNYYISSFSILFSLKSWHFINVALDMFSTNTFLFDNRITSNEMFIAKSIQLLQVGNNDVGSDLDVAIDCFLMIVFNTEYLKNYRILLSEFAANNPENVYSSDILELDK